MTLLQMQYFMEVCRCGSTLKAAQAANVSQSTISMAIRALEKELSIPLFDRSSKGLAPNAAGSFFLDQCSGILKKTERLAEEMKHSSPSAVLSVWAFQWCSTNFTGWIFTSS